MPIADPYQDALRQALVGAVGNKLVRDRRRAVARRVAVTLAVVVALVATVVTVTLPDNRAAASIEVDVRDGAVFVRLLDFETRPDEIVGELRNAGLDVVVEEVPVGSSNVGHFVALSSSEGGKVDIVRDETSSASFSAFTVPPGFVGQLRLTLGRRAAPGETWRVPSDATARAEVLACREIRGLTAAEAAPRLSDGPTSVNWLAVPDGLLEQGAELRAPYDGWRVIDLVAFADGRVLVSLTVDGRWPYLTKEPPLVPPNCKGK